MEVITKIQGDDDSTLTPLFIVHAISGLALPFLHLESLSPDTERLVYGITSPLHCPGWENFKLPPTLRDLASLYVKEIRKIQPEGPYLLAGWSMGGMVAMNMAQIILDQGEQVLKVIMIDSANPESFPAFLCEEDHKSMTEHTFIKNVPSAEPPEPEPYPVSSPLLESDIDMNEYLATRDRRRSTWASTGGVSSSISSSSNSSEFGDDAWTPGSPRSAYSASDYDEEDILECSLDGDEEEDSLPSPEQEFLRKIKHHIHHGLLLISSIDPGQLLPANAVSDFDVALIKCTPDPVDAPPRLPDEHPITFVRGILRERAMRWDAEKFRSFVSIPFSGDHDGAFSPPHIGELSGILRKCLAGME